MLMTFSSIPMKMVRTLAEFFETVDSVTKRWEGDSNEYVDPWFRGQSSAAHKLVPSFYRIENDGEIDEDDFRDEFSLKAFPYLQQMRAEGDWESYALMQHYGLPTRLLDWSEAALVALYFAVSGTPTMNNAAVWMLHPWTLNELSMNYEWILDSGDDRVADYLPDVFTGRDDIPNDPIALQIPYNSPRITAQRGLFTIHGRKKTPLEEVMAPRSDRLVKIQIPADRVIAMRRQLYTAGVSEAALFPELGALCRDLKRHWIDDREDVAPEKSERKIKPKSHAAKRKKK